MLATDSLQEVSPLSSLQEIMAILSIEYGDDLTSLAQAPHHWLIIKDEATGVMGGLCLTPRSSVPLHPMLADFCRNLKSDHGWIASHLFCWVSQHLDENDKEEVQQAVKGFFAELYRQLVEFGQSINTFSLWMLATDFQYVSAADIGLLPFDKAMPFTHQGESYVAALLSISSEAQGILWQRQVAYGAAKYNLN